MSRAEPTVNDVIRVGKVSAVFPERSTATVEFKDRDGLVSKELAIMQGNTLKDRDYRLMDVGEHVVCAFFGNGLSEGVVLGAIYDRKNDNDTNDVDVRRTTFEDGADILYNRKEHRLIAYIPGDVEVSTDSDVSAQVGGSLSADVGGDASINAGGAIVINGASGVNITAGSGGATLSGDFTMMGALSITGDVAVNGSINATGSIIDAGGNTPNHSH